MLSPALIFLLNRIIVAHKDKVAWISFGIIGICLVGSLLGVL